MLGADVQLREHCCHCELTFWLLSAKAWHHQTAVRCQCWVTAVWTTEWVRTQPHPSANRLNTKEPTPAARCAHIHGSSPPGSQNPAPPTNGQTLAPPARKPTEVSRPASTTRRRARKQEKLRLAMWATPILGTAWALPYPLTGQHDLTPWILYATVSRTGTPTKIWHNFGIPGPCSQTPGTSSACQ